MRLQAILLAAGAAMAAGSAQAGSVELRDAVIRVTVVPENRSDVRVEIVRPNPDLPLTVRTEGDRTVVDGDLRRRIRDCHGDRVSVRGVGRVTFDEMPQVVIRTPRDVSISANGAVTGQIGRSGSLDLSNSGCSRWTIADVAGNAEIHESGAGSVRMGASDHLEVKLSGAGNVHATEVRRGLDANLSGAGGVNVASFAGPLNAQVSGVGKVKVTSGRASSVQARVSGVGGVEFGGSADSLDATISGLGGVKVKTVNGPIRQRVSGIGKISIGND